MPSDAGAGAELPILVVDDDADQRRAIARLAHTAGWEAVACANADEALRALETRAFSLVISDQQMPGMDGIELLALVRGLAPETERILVTGAADLHALTRAVNEARVSSFVAKPWEPATLVTVLAAAREQHALRRDRNVLLERLANRNEELVYLNQRLGARAALHDEALQKFRRRWDVALNAISELILVVAPSLRIEGANAAAAVVAGVDAGSLEGQRCHEALFGRPTPCEGCPLGAGTGELAHEGRTYQARAYRLPGTGAAQSSLVVYRDVTVERAAARRAAEHDKRAAVGELAGGVADRINNPLHAILAFVQLAQRDDVDPEKLPRYLDAIHESALRARDVVDGIRELSRHAPQEKPGDKP